MSKHSNIDLLNEERLVNSKATQPDPYPNGGGYSSGMTYSFNSPTYNAEYDPDKYQEKIYSQEDMDKVVMMLTLYIDDQDNRIQLEEAYQAMKDQGKI